MVIGSIQYEVTLQGIVPATDYNKAFDLCRLYKHTFILSVMEACNGVTTSDSIRAGISSASSVCELTVYNNKINWINNIGWNI